MSKRTENVRISKEMLDVIDRRRAEFGLSRPDMSRIMAKEMDFMGDEIELVRRKNNRSKVRTGGNREKKFRLFNP